VPITAVASVFPERRFVVLKVDGRVLSSTLPGPDARAGENAGDQANSDSTDPASKLSTGSAGPALPPTHAAGQPAPEQGQRDQSNAARHLLFVSTSHGYVLLEREGPPPPLGQGVEVPEQQGSFRVAKLAPSPLPNDQRICVYLERTE
jgi:hypothetical protein